jgi:hypothetical protein
MISFIIPAHKEQVCLPGTLDVLIGAADKVGQPYEVIVVNDASTDATGELASGSVGHTRRPSGAGDGRARARTDSGPAQCVRSSEGNLRRVLGGGPFRDSDGGTSSRPSSGGVGRRNCSANPPSDASKTSSRLSNPSGDGRNRMKWRPNPVVEGIAPSTPTPPDMRVRITRSSG